MFLFGGVQVSLCLLLVELRDRGSLFFSVQRNGEWGTNTDFWAPTNFVVNGHPTRGCDELVVLVD